MSGLSLSSGLSLLAPALLRLASRRLDGDDDDIQSDDFARYSDFSDWLDILYLVLAILCVIFSGIASGLTLGLLSIEPMWLQIKINSGTEIEKRSAIAIAPLLENRHFLLVTLLLTNAAANEALPVLLDQLMPDYLAVIISIVMVLIFGSIIPMALFSGENQLAISSSFTYFVIFLEVIFGIFAYPTGMLLDCMFGVKNPQPMSHDELHSLFLVQKQIQAQDAARRKMQDKDGSRKRISSDLEPLLSKENKDQHDADGSGSGGASRRGSGKDLETAIAADETKHSANKQILSPSRGGGGGGGAKRGEGPSVSIVESNNSYSSDGVERFLFTIHCLDDLSGGLQSNGARFGGSIKRMKYLQQHKAWQAETSSSSSRFFINKVAAGPLESDDGRFMIGNMFIVEATREEAESFISKDPFKLYGVWEKIVYARYCSIPDGILPVLAQQEGDDGNTVKMVVV